MILDSSKVSLADGSVQAAIDLVPGREILSYSGAKMAKAQVTERIVGSGSDVIGLVLSNGQKLCGTRWHTVATFTRKGRLLFKEFSEIKIGDVLRGERAGMPIVVGVIGLMYFPAKAVRLVDVQTANGRPYIAESVLCR